MPRSSLTLRLCDAVASELNAGQFALPFVAAVDISPDFPLEQLHELKVVVCPAPRARDALTRDKSKLSQHVDVGVLRRLDVDPAVSILEAADALLALVEALENYLDRRPLATYAGQADWKAAKTVPGYEAGYDPDLVHNARCFVGVIRVEYFLGAVDVAP